MMLLTVKHDVFVRGQLRSCLNVAVLRNTPVKDTSPVLDLRARRNKNVDRQFHPI